MTIVAPVTAPTPTPTPDELAPIRAALQRYFDARDTLFHDPTKVDPKLIPTVAIDQAARALDQTVRTLRERGYRAEGKMTQRGLSVTAPETSGGTTTSLATYCDDNSTVTVLNSSGAPVNEPPRTFPTRTTLTLMPSGSWIVSESTNEVASC